MEGLGWKPAAPRPELDLPEGVKLIWSPQPGPQEALIACPVFEVFFGGARGGGKTEASLGDWLHHSEMYKENAIGLFVRRKLTELSEAIARSKQLFTPLGAKYNEQKKEWKMKSGARLRFAYLERDSDAEAYQGHSYTRIYVEELCNFPSPAPINKLRATLRSGAGVPCGMRLTGNPGGPGHNWVKARYVDPAPMGWKIITESVEIEIDGIREVVSLDRVFIPSKLVDNKLLMRNDPTYVLRLRQSGSEALVRAWLEGDWSVVDGAFFNEIDYKVHVLDALAVREFCRANPQALRFRSFDWGSAKPFSVIWYILTDRDAALGRNTIPKNSLIAYKEWYGASGPNVGLKMSAENVARGIKEREKGERISYGVADPAIFTRDGGPSIAEMMAIVGISWRRADNKRKPGWEKVRQMLHHSPTVVPRLYFSEDCSDLLRTLPTLQHDDLDSEDLDTEGEDHAADSLRYGVMSRPSSHEHQEEVFREYPKAPNEMTFKDMMEHGKKSREMDENWD